MKLKITLLLLLICPWIYGQTYKSIIEKAHAFYENEEYKKSVDKYSEAFKLKKIEGRDFYNAACSASLVGQKELAYTWLNLAVKNGWSNIRHLKTDPDLASLHNSEQWNKLLAELQKVVDRKEAHYDKPLQNQLLSIFDDDQNIRRQYMAAQEKFGYESSQVDSLENIMMHIDSINLIKVTEILDKHGWVGPDKIGESANQTLFLVIQHADLETQQKYLPVMREAVKNKAANSSALALLEDRVALGEGRRQIYGSQIGYDEDAEKSFVLPLDDPDNVDKRRVKVGLDPMSAYVKGWNIQWDAEQYKKDLPGIEAKLAREK